MLNLLLGYMGHLGDLLQWGDVRRMRRSLTSFSQELLGQSLPNLECRFCKVRRQKLKFLLPPPYGEILFG